MRRYILKKEKKIDLTDPEMIRRKELFEEFFRSPNYKPMRFKAIATLFSVPKEERNDMRLILEALKAEGKIAENGTGEYYIPGADEVVGTFQTTSHGYGFLIRDDGLADVFIPEEDTGSAMNGDKVRAKLAKDRRGRDAGRIIAVTERAVTKVVGTFTREKNFGFVIPDNRKLGTDIYIPKSGAKDVPKGYKVVAEITDYGDSHHSPEGKIVEVLGDRHEKGMDIFSIAVDAGIPTEFPEAVLKAAKKEPKEVKAPAMEGRLDLRDKKIVTIDGIDAKDLDDAISVEKEVSPDGRTLYHLGVHIADVSNYVKEGSVLDKEALERSTSVYLIDRVIPMLPVELSNGICSLNEGVDRLTLSCLMDIDEKGNIVSHTIAETVIRTAHRMNYPDVDAIITDNTEFPVSEEKYAEILKVNADVIDVLKTAYELAKILRARRFSRGALDFDFPEPKFVLDERGRAVDVKPYERNEATKLIEDFMLAANETVAEDAYWQDIPFLYRVHENPDDDKISELAVFIRNFGLTLSTGKSHRKPAKAKGISKYIPQKKEEKADSDIHPKDIRKLLDKVSGTENEALISRVTLRSLKRAKYDVDCEGHFGLAAKYYCHFTSPIRRYPDLQIHRIIKENLHGELTDSRVSHYRAILPGVALKTSTMERRADDAERDADKMKAAEYMSAHIGEEFDGVISGVTSWGIFVELPNTVEGMVRLSDMYDDRYEFDEQKMEVYSVHGRRVYRLGDMVTVEVLDADPEMRTIDFHLINKQE